eukprot:6462919-Amphidinium_carterae.1
MLQRIADLIDAFEKKSQTNVNLAASGQQWARVKAACLGAVPVHMIAGAAEQACAGLAQEKKDRTKCVHGRQPIHCGVCRPCPHGKATWSCPQCK